MKSRKLKKPEKVQVADAKMKQAINNMKNHKSGGPEGTWRNELSTEQRSSGE